MSIVIVVVVVVAVVVVVVAVVVVVVVVVGVTGSGGQRERGRLADALRRLAKVAHAGWLVRVEAALFWAFMCCSQ